MIFLEIWCEAYSLAFRYLARVKKCFQSVATGLRLVLKWASYISRARKML